MSKNKYFYDKNGNLKGYSSNKPPSDTSWIIWSLLLSTILFVMFPKIFFIFIALCVVYSLMS